MKSVGRLVAGFSSTRKSARNVLAGRHFCVSVRTNAVELTSVRYPDLKRGDYSVITDKDVSAFERLMSGAGRVLTDPTELDGYNTDWLKTCRGYNASFIHYIFLVQWIKN